MGGGVVLSNATPRKAAAIANICVHVSAAIHGHAAATLLKPMH